MKADGTKQILTESHMNNVDRNGLFPLYTHATVSLEKGDIVHVHVAKCAMYDPFEELLTVFGGYLV